MKNLRITNNLHKEFKLYCLNQNITMTEKLEDLIKQELDL